MGQLIGLKNALSNVMPCEFLTGEKGQLKQILDSGKAGTAAGSLGAINVWKNRHGLIAVERQVYMRRMDERVYKTISGAEKWVIDNLKKIGK